MVVIEGNQSQPIVTMPRNLSGDEQPTRFFHHSDDDSSLEIPMVLRRLPEAIKRNLRVHFGNDDGCTSRSCLGESVVDIFKLNPSCYNFREAIRIFVHLNLTNHFELVRSTLMNYSLRIYGLPECPSEDLYLAVHFFFCEVFGLECKLELCVYLVENNDASLIGIVLDSIGMVKRILKKATCLEGTGMRVEKNSDLGWILDGFCHTPAEAPAEAPAEDGVSDDSSE